MSMICGVVIGYFDNATACRQSSIVPTIPLDAKQVSRLQAVCDDLFDIQLRLSDYLSRNGLLYIEDVVVRPDTYKTAAVAHCCFGMSAIDQAHRCIIFPAEDRPLPERDELLRVIEWAYSRLDEQERQQRIEEHLQWMREDREFKRGVQKQLELVSKLCCAVNAAPEWRTATVLALAEGILAEGAFDQLPILADALEETGCTEAELLAHCRQQRVHRVGCWVIDLLLNPGWGGPGEPL